MRTSKYPLYTLKNKKINHNSLIYDLMIKSGLIRKLSSGLYTWMPIGFKIIKKILNVISEEMKKINAIEFLMPILQPSDIWKDNNKLNTYNSELFFCKSRNKKTFILSPTNEELITSIFKQEIKSYKQLPLILFQINTKFRDELRCKGGIIRTKEFIMKDAYSFHENTSSLKNTYNNILIIYKKIFNKFCLNFNIVKTYSKFIGGNISHEFQTISKSGESNIAICTNSKKAVNIEITKNISNIKYNYFLNIKENIKLININIKNLFINKNTININNVIKVFIVHSDTKHISSNFIALAVKFNDEISEFKVSKLKQIKKPLIFANNKEIYSITKTSSNFIGLINLNIPIIIDYDVSIMNDFITGANIEGKFFSGVNWYRDIKIPIVKDIRKIKNNDNSPFNKNGKLKIKKSMEIAHIFQLNDKYSKKINFSINDRNKNKKNILMGCYGIGISRIISSIIEQNNDNNGIIWPYIISPFEVALIPINYFKNKKVKNISEKIYYFLIKNNIDIILDDRKESFGVMFYDLELIGIPNILILNEENANNGKIELKDRKNKNKSLININDILKILTDKKNI